jgi:hypothetical protein
MGITKHVLGGSGHSLPVTHTFLEVTIWYQVQQHLSVMKHQEELNMHNVMVRIIGISLLQNVLFLGKNIHNCETVS